MPRFRKKPLEVDAIKAAEIIDGFGTEHECLLPQWVLDALATDEGYTASSRLRVTEGVVTVRTKQGRHVDAYAGEWIVCAAPDDLWPVAPSVFAATYEPADEVNHVS